MNTNYNQVLTDTLKKIVDMAEKIDNWKHFENDMGEITFKQKLIDELHGKKIDLSVVHAIFDKLESDGYIKSFNTPTPTLNGIFFSKSGGYITQAEKKESDETNEKTKLIIHYAYYSIATISLIAALTLNSCEKTKNCNCNKTNNSEKHN